MNFNVSRIGCLFLMAACLALNGCAATQVAISKRNLDVQTKMSDTIFLTPVSENQKTIFLQIRNTSDKQDFNIESNVQASLSAKGYTLVTNPDLAQFILQVNILQVAKSDRSAAAMAFGGFGMPFSPALTGLIAAGAASGAGFNNSSSLGLGLGAGLVDMVANSAVKDVFYNAITDIQIKERVNSTSNSLSTQTLKNGNSGAAVVTSQQTSNYNTYQTRIVSVAEKVNLDFEEAQQPLIDGLSQAVAGLF